MAAVEEVSVNDLAASSRSKNKAGCLITVAVATAVLLLVAYGLFSQRSLEGGPAPGFTLSLFDGGEVSLLDFRGQVVVLNFWASWCTPCREEAPALEQIWREYQAERLSVVGVNIKDARANAMAFIDEFEISYPNGPDSYNRISGSYRVYKVPETFVINVDGEIATRFVGPVAEEQLRDVLKELLQG